MIREACLFTLASTHRAFKQNSMATILSLKSVIALPGSMLTMDININTNMTLKLKDGRVFEFSQYQNTLYFFDTSKSVSSFKPQIDVKDCSLLQKVSGK